MIRHDYPTVELATNSVIFEKHFLYQPSSPRVSKDAGSVPFVAVSLNATRDFNSLDGVRLLFELLMPPFEREQATHHPIAR